MNKRETVLSMAGVVHLNRLELCVAGPTAIEVNSRKLSDPRAARDRENAS
jgi:hypothetical protein